MTNELHKTILAEKLDEVYDQKTRIGKDFKTEDVFREAALLAMEKQKDFQSWLYTNHRIQWDWVDNEWVKGIKSVEESEVIKLYQIYKEETKQGT